MTLPCGCLASGGGEARSIYEVPGAKPARPFKFLTGSSTLSEIFECWHRIADEMAGAITSGGSLEKV
jgi:hypothetical protein